MSILDTIKESFTTSPEKIQDDEARSKQLYDQVDEELKPSNQPFFAKDNSNFEPIEADNRVKSNYQ